MKDSTVGVDFNELRHPFKLCVAKSGHVFVHGPRDALHDGGILPVFSTRTRREAEGLREWCCVLQRDRSGLYRIILDPPWSGKEDDLDRAADRFRAAHKMRDARSKATAL